MASSEFGTGKSIVVLAVVVGCFAILWPKIFYPMMQAAFSMTAPKTESADDRSSFGPGDRPPHLHPGLMNPRLRESMARPQGDRREGRPFPHPSARQPVKPQPKSGGAMSIIMPIYTIGIVVFFLYTVLKLVFKKSDGDKKPLIKDFHMDPEYHKFVCQEPPTKSAAFVAKEKLNTAKKPPAEKREPKVLEKIEETLDEKDYEIYKLRKKLEETESAMERIMKHMGVMSDCLSKGIPLNDGDPLTENHGAVFQEEEHSKFSSTVRQRNPCVETGVDKNCKSANCDKERSAKLVEPSKEDRQLRDFSKLLESVAEDDLEKSSDAVPLSTGASCVSGSQKTVHQMENLSKCVASGVAVECFDDSDSNNDDSDENKEDQSCSARLSPSSFTAESCSEESLHIDEDTDENMPLLLDETDMKQAKIMCKCGSQ